MGNFGDVSMISFHATKIFHTAEGGALLMKDEALKERVDYLKNFGTKNEEEVVMSGINGKMSELHAALSVYNWTGDGFWTRKNIKQRRLMDLEQRYAVNKYLEFKYDFRYFARSKLLSFLKTILRVKPGWLIYYYIEIGRLHLKYLFRK